MTASVSRNSMPTGATPLPRLAEFDVLSFVSSLGSLYFLDPWDSPSTSTSQGSARPVVLLRDCTDDGAPRVLTRDGMLPTMHVPLAQREPREWTFWRDAVLTIKAVSGNVRWSSATSLRR